MWSLRNRWRQRHRRTQPLHRGTRAAARRRLRLLVVSALCCVALPLGLLLNRVYTHLSREMVYQYRSAAQDVLSRINQRLAEVLQIEEKRAFDEYSFLNIATNPLFQGTTVTTSPLSALPLDSAIPGLLGYFQLNPDGSVHSPVLPELSAADLAANASRFGFGAPELEKRLTLRRQIEQILLSGTPRDKAKQQTAVPSTLPPRPTPEAFERREGLDAGRRLLEEERDQTAPKLRKDATLRDGQQAPLPPSAPAEPTAPALGSQKAVATKTAAGRGSRKEQVALPEQATASQVQGALERLNTLPVPSERSRASSDVGYQSGPALPEAQGKKRPGAVRILTFESEVDPLRCAVLPSGHLVFFRKAWRNNLRYIQGFIVETTAFLQPILTASHQGTSLGQLTALTVQAQETVLVALSLANPTRVASQPLYRAPFDTPLDALEAVFSIAHMPRGTGATIVDVLALSLAGVLLAGHYGLYRVGMQHIALAAQRSDFVSAVSHELKTPLTSIRMYGEMLRAGWVTDEARRQTYYDFIFFESERLSRLITNVLRLARLTNHDEPLTLHTYTLHQLLDLVRSKIATQVEAAGFALVLDAPGDADATPALTVMADEDAFVQMMINLVDNALKFAAQAAPKRLDVGLRLLPGREPQAAFFVRDYGPGVAPGQMPHIFQLFYRAENELTRHTQGTGIGLALVQALATQMQARVEVENRQPGAEFRVLLPVLPAAVQATALAGREAP